MVFQTVFKDHLWDNFFSTSKFFFFLFVSFVEEILFLFLTSHKLPKHDFRFHVYTHVHALECGHIFFIFSVTLSWPEFQFFVCASRTMCLLFFLQARVMWLSIHTSLSSLSPFLGVVNPPPVRATHHFTHRSRYSVRKTIN